MRTTSKNTGAFTLIEVLISVMISMIILAAFYSVYRSGNDIWEIKRTQADLEAEGRNALYQMAEELKQTTSSRKTILPAPNNLNITFYLPASAWNGTNTNLIINNATGALTWDTINAIQYQLANDVIAGRKILARIQTNLTSSASRTLARDATSIQFVDYTIDNKLYLDQLRAILTLSKITPKGRNITTTFTSIIRMRN